MSLYQRLAGIVGSFFQIGGPNGPGLNNNAGAVEARNAANSAMAVVRGATPVGPTDLTTKAYVDAFVPAGAVLDIDIAVGTAATTSSVTSIPANAIILNATFKPTTPYTAGATVSIGQTGAVALLQATDDNVPQSANEYSAPQRTAWGVAALPVLVTIGGAPAAGAGVVNVQYSLPNN
jgi:hypothetical protein